MIPKFGLSLWENGNALGTPQGQWWGASELA